MSLSYMMDAFENNESVTFGREQFLDYSLTNFALDEGNT